MTHDRALVRRPALRRYPGGPARQPRSGGARPGGVPPRRGALPPRLRQAQSRSPRASSAGSRRGTTIAAPSASVLIPPTAVATTGSPSAQASPSTIGDTSNCEGMTRADARVIRSATSSGVSQPSTATECCSRSRSGGLVARPAGDQQMRLRSLRRARRAMRPRAAASP